MFLLMLLLCLARVGLRGHFGKEDLEHQRRQDRGDHDEQDDGSEIDRVHHADLQAFLGHDQGHLAAGHHADTHLEGIAPAETAELCGQTAADDLGDKRDDHKTDAEQQDFCRQAADIGLQADAREKTGANST